MTRERFDVVVIGAGIHGVGVAQAAAAAGWSVLVLEEQTVAAGTSSRSSKLVHGGLRYLESAQLALVHESLSERTTLLRIAPHLVRLVPFLIPIYRTTSRRPWQIRAGLSLYALLGHLRKDAWFSTVPRSEWDALDGLRTDGLQQVFCYHDGQTDDARLARAVMRSAEDLGARLACPARLLDARRDGDTWTVRYEKEGGDVEVDAATLVNAAGPWIEQVRARLTPEPPGFAVDLVGGAHIELEGEVTRGVYYTEAPSDGRAVFVMPWKGHTLVGTTETRWDGDPRAVEPAAAEIEYLHETLQHYFPERNDATIGAWAGLRVLPRRAGRAFDRRRETTLVVDEEARPRVVGIYGGKLTGYRATAVKVVDTLARTLPLNGGRADTATLMLPDVE